MDLWRSLLIRLNEGSYLVVCHFNVNVSSCSGLSGALNVVLKYFNVKVMKVLRSVVGVICAADLV